jgi:hypothetical protein
MFCQRLNISFIGIHTLCLSVTRGYGDHSPLNGSEKTKKRLRGRGRRREGRKGGEVRRRRGRRRTFSRKARPSTPQEEQHRLRSEQHRLRSEQHRLRSEQHRLRSQLKVLHVTRSVRLSTCVRACVRADGRAGMRRGARVCMHLVVSSNTYTH